MCMHPVTRLCLTLCDPMDCNPPGMPLSMEFSRQEYWSRLPFPTPGDLPNPGIEPMTPMSSALAGGFFTTASPGKPSLNIKRWGERELKDPGSTQTLTL